jgi:GH24 family phage-related lysozyme (muramidase)
MVDRQKVSDLLMGHEGFRAYTYRDTRGKLTIGYGFNLDAPGAEERCAAVGVDYAAVSFAGQGITQAQALALLDEGITTAQDAAIITLAGFMDMPDVVQLVIIDMLFNLGREKFQEFPRLIAAAEAHEWQRMVNEMRASLWFGQVGARGRDDVALVLSAL